MKRTNDIPLFISEATGGSCEVYCILQHVALDSGPSAMPLTGPGSALRTSMSVVY